MERDFSDRAQVREFFVIYGYDEMQMMDYLQRRGLISDLCVTSADVPEEEFSRVKELLQPPGPPWVELA